MSRAILAVIALAASSFCQVEAEDTDRPSVAEMIARIQSSDFKERQAAGRQLAELVGLRADPDVAVMDELVALVRSRDREVARIAAAHLKGMIHSTKLSAKLLPLIAEHGLDNYTTEYALELVAQTYPCEGLDQAILTAMDHQRASVRAWAAYALGESGATGGVPYIRRIRGEANQRFSSRHFDSVSATHRKAILRLERALQDSDPDVRYMAVRGLANTPIGPSTIPEELIELLSGTDLSMQAASASALGRLRIAASAAPLGKLLHSPDPYVAFEAASSLCSLGTEALPAVHDLHLTLQDCLSRDPYSEDSRDLQRMILLAFQGIGPPARVAIPEILTIANDEESNPLSWNALYAAARVGLTDSRVIEFFHERLTEDSDASKSWLIDAISSAVLDDPATAIKSSLVRDVVTLATKGDGEDRIQALQSVGSFPTNTPGVIGALRDCPISRVLRTMGYENFILSQRHYRSTVGDH